MVVCLQPQHVDQQSIEQLVGKDSGLGEITKVLPYTVAYSYDI